MPPVFPINGLYVHSTKAQMPISSLVSEYKVTKACLILTLEEYKVTKACLQLTLEEYKVTKACLLLTLEEYKVTKACLLLTLRHSADEKTSDRGIQART